MKLMFVALALIACEPTRAPYRTPKPESYVQLNESPRPLHPRTLESVAIYRVKVPDERFVEIAEMTDVGESESDALEKLKLSAAGVGCDGLIIGAARVDEATVSARWPGTARVEATQVNVLGTCIMFVSDPGTWQPAPEDACVAGRAQILAAKDPTARMRIAASLPPECHHK